MATVIQYNTSAIFEISLAVKTAFMQHTLILLRLPNQIPWLGQAIHDSNKKLLQEKTLLIFTEWPVLKKADFNRHVPILKLIN